MTAPTPLLFQPACFFPRNSFKRGFIFTQITKCPLFSSTALKICIENPLLSSHPPNNSAQISSTDSKLTPRWKAKSGAERRSGCGETIRAASPGCARIPSQGLVPAAAEEPPRAAGERAVGAGGSEGQPPRPARSHSFRLKRKRKKEGGGKKRKKKRQRQNWRSLCVRVCVRAYPRIPSPRDKVLVLCISLSPQGYLITADR